MAVDEAVLDNDLDIDDASTLEDLEASTAVRYAVSSYGADYTVDSLVKRMRDESIEVPHFQRGYVWTPAQASKFIESLLLGLPIPGIFLYRDPDTGRLSVIDGQQRLRTLQFFYDGLLNGREFKLRGVTKELEGRSYQTLDDNDRRRLDDATIHATVTKQDDPDNDDSSVYLIFERLNTGGSPLSSHEIRACVYHGEFIRLLEKLNGYPPWRTIFGKRNKRGKDQELILRFFALFYWLEKYERPMKLFLNRFLNHNRRLQVYSEQELTALFENTVSFAGANLGAKAFRPERNLNAAVTDAILVATARAIQQPKVVDPADYSQSIQELIQRPEFLAFCKSATTADDAVKGRIALAYSAIVG